MAASIATQEQRAKDARSALATTMTELSQRLTVDHLADTVTTTVKANIAGLAAQPLDAAKPMATPALVSGLIALAAGGGWTYARARDGRAPVAERTTRAVAANTASRPRRVGPEPDTKFWLMSAAALAAGAALSTRLPESALERRVAAAAGPVVRQGAQRMIEDQIGAAKKMTGELFGASGLIGPAIALLAIGANFVDSRNPPKTG